MELQGYVDHIIYRNTENGYTVLILQTEDSDETVTGVFRDIEDGTLLKVTGEYSHHPSYGKQFKINSYEIKEPEDVVSIERYLSSGAIKGIGASLAKRIIKAFGEDTFRIMEEEPERLVEIKGISERIARAIAEQMQEKRGLRKAMMFLQELGLSTNMSMKVYAQYGAEVFTVIKENPYKLVEDIQGIGFKTADDIADHCGIRKDSEYRIQSGIIYTLSSALLEGHTFLQKEDVVERASELLNVDSELVDVWMDNLTIEKKIIVKEELEQERVFLSLSYYMELSCARMLTDLDLKSQDRDDEILKRLEKIEKASGIQLDEKQREAALMAVKSGVCVITGGPGTGKTTIIKVLLAYFDEAGLDVLLAAPTGRAAKRMTEATGYEARTIHRMLEIGGDSFSFARNSSEPLETDVVIIDEMSMVDIYLFNALLKAITIGTRLIMVGDASQLPSVGPGSVLKDVIESGIFNVAVLDHIFRQAAESDIVTNAHKINKGLEIALDNRSKDFFFLERDDTDVIIEGMVYLVTKKLPPYVDAKPFDIQIMTPMRKGVLGVDNLNKVLQDRLNPLAPGKNEITYGQSLFREGDKVMQIKNNYQAEWEIRSKYGIKIDSGMGVYNGDIGIVSDINKDANIMTVTFDDNRQVIYTGVMLEELELAYAITVHKSQGSEYPAVVMPLMTGPAMLMNRNLLYTAVTRARKCVTIIGSSRTVGEMIANNSEQIRYTALRERIREIV